MKKIVILGSTGSIGKNTLEVVRKNREKFEVVGLACKENKKLLSEQIEEFRPKYAYIEKKDEDFFKKFPYVKFFYGDEGLVEISTVEDADLVIAAIPGIKGLAGVIESLKKGKTIGLATKEIMVVGGNFIIEAAKDGNGKILPVDSEHNAIFQILENENIKDIEKIYLTCSGGPLLGRENIEDVKIEEVISHPVWKMGKKISVDSATLMNKCFEIIEAHYLFSLPPEKIDILIHPEAVIHGIVEFKDGFQKGIFSLPDMKYAISFVLNYPERGENYFGNLRLEKIEKLTFKKPESNSPWLLLARKSLEEKGSYPVVLNGADEEAVELFLKGEIKFSHIIKIVQETFFSHKKSEISSIDDIFEINKWAHNQARKIAERLKC